MCGGGGGGEGGMVCVCGGGGKGMQTTSSLKLSLAAVGCVRVTSRVASFASSGGQTTTA